MNKVFGGIPAEDLQSRGGWLPRAVFAAHDAHSNGLVAESGKLYIANGPDASGFLEGGSQVFESDCEAGYVVVFYRGDVLGCGLYSHGKLVSQIPKERRMASTTKDEACQQ